VEKGDYSCAIGRRRGSQKGIGGASVTSESRGLEVQYGKIDYKRDWCEVHLREVEKNALAERVMGTEGIFAILDGRERGSRGGGK